MIFMLRAYFYDLRKNSFTYQKTRLYNFLTKKSEEHFGMLVFLAWLSNVLEYS